MELRESFRGPFLELAWQRHARITELVVGGGDLATFRSAASELHCLSGEASMLDFGAVADIARSAEVAAKSGDRETLVKLIARLDAAIRSVAAAGNTLPSPAK